MISAAQLRAARALIGWSQKVLADTSGLSLPTIQRMETLGPNRSSAGNVEKVQRALGAAGIEFTDDDAPGVRLTRSQSSAR